jgi:hypothetical protein
MLGSQFNNLAYFVYFHILQYCILLDEGKHKLVHTINRSLDQELNLPCEKSSGEPYHNGSQLKYFRSYSSTGAAYWTFSHESMVKY